jgi:Undecaprenyl-phosphate glucose phosphotransferase
MPGHGHAAADTRKMESNTAQGKATSSIQRDVGIKPARVHARSLLTRRVVADVMLVCETALILATLIASHYLYHWLAIGPWFEWPRYITLFVGVSLLAVGIFRIAGLYRFPALLSPLEAARPLLMSWTLLYLGIIALLFLIKSASDFSRATLVLGALMAPIALLLARSAIARFLTREHRLGHLLNHVAIVGATAASRELYRHLEHQATQIGLQIIGVFEDRTDRIEMPHPGTPMRGPLEELAVYARSGNLDQIIIALPWTAEERIGDILARLAHLPVNISLCPDLAGMRFARTDYRRLGGIPLLEVQRHQLHDWARVLKSLEDYILGTLILAAALPVMAVIALLIKLDSPGPVLFRQRRHGLQNDVINVFKFRTMRVMENGAEVTQASRNDSRVTRVGRVLRRLSLDELPQLFNVLNGEMSLVGPRPHAVAHNEYYEKVISAYGSRHRMKPGITGLAQVEGYRGEITTPTDMENRIRLDRFYIDNWSLELDVKILARTILAVLKQTNAY